ncbi:bifunctional phosphopantothenoylcysteine decarboxylase/phosphopantothenate--cysteine ligase CoaBC [Methanobacterium paludis]|uniref:Coenzyme A biosynthesis bifunctional protein CoaBC n=1 Tax=Methanobacterium paludis (strain DSM 25820 / JCM 18151 / SWAN1) TaxID=868131 RepID=F6D3F7_METPW|nr:bifunctional phosphopantothenoylcysteine decarboxylase/phosphopantothenate--cysteine ligase CoaBC [Methanobacterium paludis]AEG19133.1 phosphopantothenoylcysteine decarboxylase/phosphopantothenate/cysteine ligase [Methanobacterium paludis]
MEIVLCVTGSIAAIESVKLARELKRQGVTVKCFMSDDACGIIHPHAMEFATGQDVVVELTGEIEHVKYAQTDLILVAPATANVISKFAYKIADNPINTLLITAFGHKTPIIFVPSMHESMYTAVERNIQKLKDEGIIFLEPKKEEGKAKFPDIHDITLQALRELCLNSPECQKSNFKGKNVLVSAGATFEEIDPVRGITNRSSGKMGVEIAKDAFIRGAEVTMLCGKMETRVPKLFDVVEVESTAEMQDELQKLLPKTDVFVSAAAVSDFTVDSSAESTGKISSDEDLILKLKRTPKIISSVKEINPKIYLVGFKAEYNVSNEELIESARKRMEESGADLMIANDVAVEGAGFGSDKNEVIILDGNVLTVPLTSKSEIAQRILDKILENL